MIQGVKITGTGSYVPERVMTNHDLEEIVDTSDEWILARTGIRERRIAADNQPTSALAAEAAKRALKVAGRTTADIDLIIVATFTPDRIFPNTACFVQKALGASNAACFSMEAACSGFTYALETASSLLRTGAFKCALVIGAEKLSSVIDWTDRTTCVLFGDGAGAVILETCPPEENHFLSSELGANGEFTDILHIPAGGTEVPFSQNVLDQRLHCLQMSGKEVFKLAVNTMATAASAAVEKAGIEIDDIDWLVPHQANTRIIKGVGKRLGIPEERVFMNLEKYGNTSAASIPLALDEMVQADLIKPGDHVLLVAFGGGLTWGANVIRW